VQSHFRHLFTGIKFNAWRHGWSTACAPLRSSRSSQTECPYSTSSSWGGVVSKRDVKRKQLIHRETLFSRILRNNIGMTIPVRARSPEIIDKLHSDFWEMAGGFIAEFIARDCYLSPFFFFCNKAAHPAGYENWVTLSEWSGLKISAANQQKHVRKTSAITESFSDDIAISTERVRGGGRETLVAISAITSGYLRTAWYRNWHSQLAIADHQHVRDFPHKIDQLFQQRLERLLCTEMFQAYVCFPLSNDSIIRLYHSVIFIIYFNLRQRDIRLVLCGKRCSTIRFHYSAFVDLNGDQTPKTIQQFAIYYWLIRI